MKKLRPYQEEGKSKLRESMRAGNKRVVFYLPTGGGKSICAVDLIKSAQERGKRVAFIANRIGLVKQFSKHLWAAGVRHGVIQGQNTNGLHCDVLVCSIDTVGNRGLPDVDMIIIDEAHGAAGNKKYLEVIFRNSNLPIVGLTATPFAKGMAKSYPELAGRALFEDMVIAATIQELIEMGSLLDCEIFAPSQPDLAKVKMKRMANGEMDYQEKSLGEAVDKPELIGDIVSNWFKLASGKKTVVFATNVAHSRHIVEQFQACGIKAEHVDGYMDDEEKQPIFDRFEKDETLILSNVQMLSEGWDVPSCEVMILARPTKSLTRYIQMCGRVLRIHEGKTKATIIDHSGSVHIHGYPTDDLPLELCDGKPKQGKERKEQGEKKEKKCPKCHLVKKTLTCGNCGFTPEIANEVEIVDGTLGKVEKKKAFTHDEKQRIWSECLGLSRQRGKSQGWASHLYKSITTVFPRSLADVPLAPSQQVVGKATSNAIAWAKRLK